MSAGVTSSVGDVRLRPRWRGLPSGDDASSPVLALAQYYDLFAPDARAMDVWDTEYHHVVPGVDGVVE